MIFQDSQQETNKERLKGKLFMDFNTTNRPGRSRLGTCSYEIHTKI
jgi:hypothetical protein